MREIVLDTETTGLDPKSGHRVVEIGCVEIHNKVPTGTTYHQYINPERDMPTPAFDVHGLSEVFLKDHPVFAQIADDFLSFIDGAPLVIHNASFDMKFLNHELALLKKPAIPFEQAIDTLRMARQKFPGAQASLDALCRRFEINNAQRTLHGALLDSELLAEVYLELCGGRQQGLMMEDKESADVTAVMKEVEKTLHPARPHHASEQAQADHKKFLKKITDPIWVSSS